MHTDRFSHGNFYSSDIVNKVAELLPCKLPSNLVIMVYFWKYLKNPGIKIFKPKIKITTKYMDVHTIEK